MKAWLRRSIVDLRKSTARDYPPKRKKPWLSGSFPDMEEAHYSTYRRPWFPSIGDDEEIQPPFDPDLGPPPKDPQFGGPCAGRVLKVFPSDMPCDAEDSDDLEFDIRGAVGDVEITPTFVNEVNEEGDPLGEGCPDGDTPYVVFWVCDDCGCATATVWLDDCTDCDPTPVITCGELPCDEITSNDSKAYSLQNAVGIVTWDVTGEGATISDGGILTTTGAACGTLTITATDSCCGEFTQKVRVTDSGYWGSYSTDCDDSSYCGSCCTDPGCPTGTGCPNCVCIVGVNRYSVIKGCLGDCACSNPCSGGTASSVLIADWLCSP